MSYRALVRRTLPLTITLVLGVIVIIDLYIYLGLTEGVNGPLYLDIFQWMGASVLSTMTGMLALYSLSAAFRAWHARTLEALVMIIAGFLVVMGLIAPIGEIIW